MADTDPIPLTLDQQARCALRDAASLVLLGWERVSFARDRNGYAVDERDESARAWCTVGALILATPVDLGIGIFDRCLTALWRVLGDPEISVSEWQLSLDPDTGARTVAAALCRAADAIGRGEA